jgi:hypothetical protein
MVIFITRKAIPDPRVLIADELDMAAKHPMISSQAGGTL